MSLGSYGTKRPADMSPEDVEIIMNFTPSRDVTSDFKLKKLSAVDILTPYFHNEDTGGNVNTEILGGLYNLKLPREEFNEKGIYTLYIRPSEIRTSITDCGVLSSLPNVKGIIIDLNNVPSEFRNRFINQGLVGYRIEYLNSDGSKISNFFRLITSSFFCEPVVTNLTNSSQRSIRYRYVEEGSDLLFCTLTPSASPTNKPSATPFIGNPGQNIIITNTFFNPTTLEIEIADYDLDTIGIGLFGNQTKSMEDGIYTIYDSEGNIYKQYDLFEIRDEFQNILFEVRRDRLDNIDFSKSFINIIE